MRLRGKVGNFIPFYCLSLMVSIKYIAILIIDWIYETCYFVMMFILLCWFLCGGHGYWYGLVTHQGGFEQ